MRRGQKGGRILSASDFKKEEMNSNWYIYSKKGWKKMNKGFYLWSYFVIAGLLALLAIQNVRYSKQQNNGFVYQWVELGFNYRMPTEECWVSPDLEKYLNWIWLSERRAYHITEISGRGYKNTIWIRGSQSPRPILATFVSQRFLAGR